MAPGETLMISKLPAAVVVAFNVALPTIDIETPASAAPPVAAVTRPRTIAVVAICESGMVPASSVWPEKTVYESEAVL